MDYRKILIEATNDFLDDEDDVIDLDTIETNPEIPAYLRKPIDKDEPAIDDDDIEVPAHLRNIDKTVDEPEVKVTNVEIPAFVRLEPRTDYSQEDFDDINDPINNVPEDEEVPAFLRAKGAKVNPEDIEKPAFARKKAADIIKGSGAELRRFESVNYFLEGFDDDDDESYQARDRRIIHALAEKLGLPKNKFSYTANWATQVWDIITTDGTNGIFLIDGEDDSYYVDKRFDDGDRDDLENIFVGSADEMVEWLTPEKVEELRRYYKAE